jgi:hypothetical protein
MQTLESSTALDHDALQTAINTSKDSAYVRGVKRLCVGPGESAEVANVELPQPGRPFLETKWESEVSRKRRECRVSSARCISTVGSLIVALREIAGYAI